MATANFDEKTLYALVEQIAYPRLVGTPGEKKVIGEIKAAFEGRGFAPAEVLSHPFRTTMWFAGIFLQTLTGVLAAIIWGILLTWVFAGVPWLWLWLAGFGAAAAFFGTRTDGTRWTVAGVDTENVFVRVPPTGEKRGTIVFGSHLDSKSQAYPAMVRAAFYIFGILLGVPFLLVSLVNLLLVTFGLPDNTVLLLIAQVVGWPAGGCFFILMFNRVQNRSLGALDNATAVAIVLELARHFKASGGLAHHEVICCTFTAEEIGVLGSAFWFKRFGKEFDSQMSYLINFDMVGKPGIQYMGHIGFPKKPTNHKLNSLAEAVANDLGVPLLPSFWMPIGAMTDRWPFAKAGWEAIDFITRSAALNAHTTRDTMAYVDGKFLAQACEIAREMAQRIDAGKINR